MSFNNHQPLPKRKKVSVEHLQHLLKKRVQVDTTACASSSNCDEKIITEVPLHRPGLALAGYTKLFTYQRIQIIGNTESQYLSNFTEKDQKKAFKNLIDFDIPVIFLTSGNQLPQSLLDMAEEADIPIFKTSLETTKFMALLRGLLEDLFAKQTVIHGSMVDVYGIGILVTGKSGIGKSEVALDLVERGHRLVADDVVILTQKQNVLIGSATDVNKHYMEIRGLGIIDIMSMFGIRSIRYQKRLEVIVELTLWDDHDVQRTGLDREHASIMGTEIPYIHLPITPGKNITVIAEVIAMNHLLSHYGYDAAKVFQDKLREKIENKQTDSPFPSRMTEYFEGDFE